MSSGPRSSSSARGREPLVDEGEASDAVSFYYCLAYKSSSSFVVVVLSV
jgi:hypothetical protein